MSHELRLAFVLSVWAAVAISQDVAWGNNNLFLPGDAFFPAVLTAKDMARMKADPENPPVFEYSSFGGYEGAFCGYAGYSRARVSGLDETFVGNLKNAYAHVRKFEPRKLVEETHEGKTKLIETNGIRVLFYSRDFEFPKHRLGLRYNENWVAEVAKFGHNPGHIRLCCLVDDKDAVMESWRDSTLVAGLNVSLPDVELKPVPVTTAPVTIRGPLKALVLGSQPLTAYFRPRAYEASVLIVDSAGITEISYEEGEWVTKAKE